MADATPQAAQLQNATEMIKVDITLLAAQTRGWAGMLFRAIARNDRDAQSAFSACAESFWQLYKMIKYNAAQTGKIPDWAEKQKAYDEFFWSVLQGKYMPVALLEVYDMFTEDLRRCGIYDLSAGEYVRRS